MYEAKNFDHLLGTEGFSDPLLKNHFTLYQGYVKNTNILSQELKNLEAEGKSGSPAFAELKRRFGWEFNGMRLHELYFGNMTKKKTDLSQNSPLYKKMVETFASGQACENVFVETGKMRGIGWVIMTYDPIGKKLFHLWINEHDVGHLAGTVPLLIMDVFEHAFMLDYGLNRADYIKAFINAIDWEVVQKRYDEAQM